MKCPKTLLAAVVFAACCGCTSVHSAKTFNNVLVDGARTPMETVEIENSGWLVFNCLPIASGNPERPGRNSCRWFRNTVTLDNNMTVLRAHMAESGVDEVANLTSHFTDESYLVFLLKRRACHTSAVLLAPEQTEERK